jgi:hypothetical protein
VQAQATIKTVHMDASTLYGVADNRRRNPEHPTENEKGSGIDNEGK